MLRVLGLDKEGGGRGEGAAKNIDSVCMLLYPNAANQFSFNWLISVFSFFFKLTANCKLPALAGDALRDGKVTKSSTGTE